MYMSPVRSWFIDFFCKQTHTSNIHTCFLYFKTVTNLDIEQCSIYLENTKTLICYEKLEFVSYLWFYGLLRSIKGFLSLNKVHVNFLYFTCKREKNTIKIEKEKIYLIHAVSLKSKITNESPCKLAIFHVWRKQQTYLLLRLMQRYKKSF